MTWGSTDKNDYLPAWEVALGIMMVLGTLIALVLYA